MAVPMRSGVGDAEVADAALVAASVSPVESRFARSVLLESTSEEATHEI
jgi:hypothetical protein